MLRSIPHLGCANTVPWIFLFHATYKSFSSQTLNMSSYLYVAGHSVGGLRGHHPGVPTELEPRGTQHIRQREGRARVAGVVLPFGEVGVPVLEISCVNRITKPCVRSFGFACRTPRRGGGSSSPRSPRPGTRDRSPGISEVKKTSCFE